MSISRQLRCWRCYTSRIGSITMLNQTSLVNNKTEEEYEKLRFNINGLLWMTAGTLSIFVSMYLINIPDQSSGPVSSNRVAEFTVAPPLVKLKPKKKLIKTPKKINKLQPPPLPPSFASSDLPGFELGVSGAIIQGMGQAENALLGNTQDVIMTVDTVDVAPRVSSQTPLEYPPRAKYRKTEGYVVLSLLISKNGGVKNIRIVETSPKGVFDSAATQSVKKWRFVPARYQDKPVSAWANFTVRFKLG